MPIKPKLTPSVFYCKKFGIFRLISTFVFGFKFRLRIWDIFDSGKVRLRLHFFCFIRLTDFYIIF